MLHIYRASAGSGKTHRLTQEYIHLLFDPRRERAHRRILAVTFTNKATDEMKTRILKELHLLSQGQASDYRAGLAKKFNMDDEAVNERAKHVLITLLHDYSSFSISTIDRFFQQVIRSFARDIGVHGGYNLELDNLQTLEQSVDNLFMDLSKEENKQLLQWLTSYAEERIESSENWNMRGNIMELGQEIFKENYQHKAEETNRKLHEREFLSEYRKKLRAIKADFEERTKQIAAQALKIMASHGLTHEDFSYKTTLSLEKMLKGKIDVSKRLASYADDVANCYTKSKPQDIKSAIELAYQSGLQACFLQIVKLASVDIVNYNSAKLVLKHINTLGILSDLAMQVKNLTDEQNTMLISDSNMLLNKIIDNSEAPFVYEKTGIQIENFMIDEFQDTSTLQWKNFHPLLANSLSEGRFNLVVGDVKQSIYRWRNSDWKLLDEQILTDFRSDELHTENLDTNWRSDRNIIEFNNAFFILAAQILQGKLNSGVQPMLQVYPRLETLLHKVEHAYANVRQKSSPNAGTGHVQMTFIPTDQNEEGWKAESLGRLPAMLEDLQDRGYRPTDICILVRDKKDAHQIINHLLTYKTSEKARPGYCYDILGNEGLLIGTSASVRFVLGLLQLFLNPDDTIQKTIVNYEYARGRLCKPENEALNSCFIASTLEGNSYSALFTNYENERLQHVQHGSLYDMVEQIIALFGIGSWHNEAVFIQAFQDLVFKYSAGKTADLNSFLNWWKASGSKQFIATPDNQNAMRIMTIHKSKGLDFKVVLMPFCEWELDMKKGNLKNFLWCEPDQAPFNELPLLPVLYNNELEKSIFAEDFFDEKMHRYIDNLNLAYVAFTRAKNELICMAPAIEQNDPEKINSFSALLNACFHVPTAHTDSGIISLESTFNNETGIFELGEPVRCSYHDKPSENINIKMETYPCVSSSDRLRIRHKSLEYLLENQQLTDSRLNYGIIMHDILRQIIRKSDQTKAIQDMIRSGRINEYEGGIVEKELEHFWRLPETDTWFTGDARVLTETSILMAEGTLYRPDRVVIRGNEATIIDYKFGDVESKSHFLQVRQYMDLIAQMGYKAEGFICYVTLKKVEKVE